MSSNLVSNEQAQPERMSYADLEAYLMKECASEYREFSYYDNKMDAYESGDVEMDEEHYDACRSMRDTSIHRFFVFREVLGRMGNTVDSIMDTVKAELREHEVVEEVLA